MNLQVRFFRSLIRNLLRIVYRVTIVGGENIPAAGPVLFISNHVSYVDPMLISYTSIIPIRFLMWRPIYEWKLMKWFFKLMRAIPISAQDPPRQMLESLAEAREALKNGDRLCIFAEGEISRTGAIQGFLNGYQRVSKDNVAPLIPVNIEDMWGSIFSFERGKFFWKIPKKIPYPVRVFFGPPLPDDSTADEIRDAVVRLRTEVK